MNPRDLDVDLGYEATIWVVELTVMLLTPMLVSVAF